MDQLWRTSRHGSNAGRGFHYQDAVATHLAILGWSQALPLISIIPEGFEDISVQMDSGWLHVQAKSRRATAAPMSTREVAEFLSGSWKNHEARIPYQPSARLALVVERLPEDLSATNWLSVISQDLTLLATLRPRLLEELGDQKRVDDLVANTSLICISDPKEADLRTISSITGLPLRCCSLHYHELHSIIASYADANGATSASRPKQIGIADVGMTFERATELIDFESLSLAIKSGTCESADFITQIHDARFYEGIDVTPGHIVSGMIIPRPGLEETVLNSIERREAVLIVGPSGSGKSSLAWSCAHASRHHVRWYRVKRLREEDVPVILRLVRAERPSEQTPVGLLVDDVERIAKYGWDLLVTEVGHYPGVRLIGTVREEDVFLLATSSQCALIRPKLDEAMAEQFWQVLVEDGKTSWTNWREPFESSQGLLLEYAYLLTTGERLKSKIASQVDRRIAEGRSLELRILRLIATADHYGATLQAVNLRALLSGDFDDVTLQAALVRLIREHLVFEPIRGHYRGLHRVRSRHVMEEVHRLGVPTITETVCALVSILDAEELQAFIVAVLTDEAISTPDVIVAAATRAKTTNDPRTFAGELYALRLVSFVQLAKGWKKVLEDCGVPPSKQVFAVELALLGSSRDFPIPSIRESVRRISTELEHDLRIDLVNILTEEDISRIIKNVTKTETACTLLAALHGIKPTSTLLQSLRALQPMAGEDSVRHLAQLLLCARGVSIELAKELCNKAGGISTLLGRLEVETPWLKNLRTETDADGTPIIAGDVRYVSPIRQPDPYADVVELCRILLGCDPEAELAVCNAIDATGRIAGLKSYPIASKRIPRRNIASEAETAWNRARIRLVTALLSSGTLTERLTTEKKLLTVLSNELSNAADLWCRGQRLTKSLDAKLLEVSVQAQKLPPFPSSSVSYGPMEQGNLDGVDPVCFMITGTVDALFRLFDDQQRLASLASYIQDSLLPLVPVLMDPLRWRLVADTPPEAVQEITKDLINLRAVVLECESSAGSFREEIQRIARRTTSARNLAKCADHARRQADARINNQVAAALAKLEKTGVDTKAALRQFNTEKGPIWPDYEIVLAIRLPSIFALERVNQMLVPALRAIFSGPLDRGRKVRIVPERNGRVIPSLSGYVQYGKYYPIPEVPGEWLPVLNMPSLVPKEANAFWQAIDALVEASSILGGNLRSEIHDIEALALQEAVSRYREARAELLATLEADHSGALEFGVRFLDELFETFQEQFSAITSGIEPVNIIAVPFIDQLNGRASETVGTAVAVPGRLHLNSDSAPSDAIWAFAGRPDGPDCAVPPARTAPGRRKSAPSAIIGASEPRPPPRTGRIGRHHR